jgi:rod shape determining protein RodA
MLSDRYSAADDGLLRELFRRFRLEPALFLALTVLVGLGLIVLYSASAQNMHMLNRQIIRLAIGFGILVFFAQIPPHTLKFWSPWLYAGGVFCLLLVFYFGHTGKGATRWLDLGLVRFQPSELMKLIVPMTVAWYITGKALPLRFGHVIGASLLILIPFALIAEQPDLGTALLVGAAGFMCIFLGGISWRLMIGGAVAVGAMMPVMWNMLHGYQQRRVLTFLNPESDPLGAGYHIIQSKIAIGSGGAYGKGWLNGTQSQLDFLPERSTDFIFSVLAEEFGLFGVLLILALYTFILWRGISIVLRARDTYSRIVGGSIILTFFVYVFVNVGMVTGVMPVVGVPLPLISYGGTSMVALMMGFGILMSINADRRLGPG